MGDKHMSRFILYTVAGLLLTTSGIICLVYGSATRSSNDWIFWAIISAFAINAGLLMLGGSIVHKIKADMMTRRRK